MENSPKSNRSSESKPKIIDLDIQEGIKERKLLKAETEKDLKGLLRLIKTAIEEINSERLNPEDQRYKSKEKILELKRQIKEYHEYMTDLDLDRLSINDEIKELKRMEQLTKNKLLHLDTEDIPEEELFIINEDRVN
jgi:hypothetical protein